ncbi:FKBP-type peptidyl-prolyl cis-trans isomerase [Brevibacterium daeguense]|uniref:Peptidyl-prolyl cis-trans isomerase n=1 Tax=Brevibacterium daeguense TaxID=909936 RepID=A0ABP8ENH6_9MICO|nr:FKBP-type peptidyl-prolyl cis-trans isomerase [Brevibacterium daeguense]
MRRSLLSALTIAVLALTGCGGSEPEPPAETGAVTTEDAKTTSLDEVTVEGELEAKPEVSFEAPLVIAESAHKVLSEGDGAAVEDGQQVTAHMTMVSGTSGEVLESSYDAESPSGFPMDTTQINQALYDSILDVPVGSRVLLSLNGSPQAGQPSQTLVYVVDVIGAENIPEPLERAEGTEVEPQEGLPEVTRDDTGKPSISQPEGEAPTELVVSPTIEGEGPEVEEGQKVNVHYTGWLWDDASEPFDSSWDRGEPFAVEGVGTAPVIEGWNEALIDQPVGSQLIVVIPPEKGYGEAGSPPSIPGNATLVFVIDILSAVG